MADRVSSTTPAGSAALKSYIICSTPRSGSTLLEQLLTSTGSMGAPDEYFNRADQYPMLCRKYGVSSTPELLSVLLREKVTGNGVFGVKIHYEQFELLRREVDLEAFLPRPSYIYLKRRDLLGQAISYSRAVATGQWSLDQAAKRAPCFDPCDVEARLDAIIAQSAAWWKYFATAGIEPLEIAYEELVEEPRKTCTKILALCGVESGPPEGLEAARTKRQADHLSLDWRERMLAYWGTGGRRKETGSVAT